MTIVHDTIAAELALLERIEPTPLAPFGYGQDLDCTTDIDQDLLEVDPSSKTALAQALLRRLSCPRGRLPDDADYGFDLRGMLNRGTDANALRDLAGQIKGEVLKDDRIDGADVTTTYTAQTETLDVTLWVVAVDPALGEFSLTFAVQAGELMLKELNG
jgi:hypothetical protein